MKLTAEYSMQDLLKLAKADLEVAGYVAIDTDSGAMEKSEVLFIFTVTPKPITPSQPIQEVAPEPVKRKRKPADPEAVAARVEKMNAARKAKRQADQVAQPAEQGVSDAAMEVVAATASPF